MKMASDSLVDIGDPRNAPPRPDDDDDVDSLPSRSSDYSEDESDAQAEWERSMEQLQLLLSMIVVPWVGKLLGRKFAFWGWAKYMGWVHHGDVRVVDKRAFNARGAVAATL